MQSLGAALVRFFTISYRPDETNREFLGPAYVQEDVSARVTVAVLDGVQSRRVFGVPMARHGVQPIYLRVENRSNSELRLQLLSIDPRYFTPLEAAATCHFSIFRRVYAFGFLAWLFLPVLLLMISKLISAKLANGRMDACFRAQAFRLRPITPGGVSEGFVFTPVDFGTKIVQVCLHATGGSLENLVRAVAQVEAGEAKQEPSAGEHSSRPVKAGTPTEPDPVASHPPATVFNFSIPVPGIKADYLRRDFETIIPTDRQLECNQVELVKLLGDLPAAVSNRKGTRSGDPTNLVIIGDFPTILSAFAARWDESETISLGTCWKTVKAFLLGSQYRYSPVSPLFLFGRSQDVALQRIRHSINERLHLRLWLTPYQHTGQHVWFGQVSRDIGVRFTTKAWNLTTHRIDPDVDESRDYVFEDLLEAERIDAAGYLDGVGPCDAMSPRRNLTGDTYYTDGKRAVIVLSEARATPRFIGWG